jgi:hypothetical protein
MCPGQSSSAPLGDRKVWNDVWKDRVPQKLRVFAWKAATFTLAVMENVHRRINTVNPICSICGREEENHHYALVRCTLARALRDGMRQHWDLPSEEVFNRDGHEWFLQLLRDAPAPGKARLVFSCGGFGITEIIWCMVMVRL